MDFLFIIITATIYIDAIETKNRSVQAKFTVFSGAETYYLVMNCHQELQQ